MNQTILRVVQATRLMARTKTNLGILLLLSPLAAVPVGEPLCKGQYRARNGLDVARYLQSP